MSYTCRQFQWHISPYIKPFKAAETLWLAADVLAGAVIHIVRFGLTYNSLCLIAHRWMVATGIVGAKAQASPNPLIWFRSAV